MLNSDASESLLVRLSTPEDRLCSEHAEHVNGLKGMFPDQSRTLLAHLQHFGVSMLEDYLVWIDPDRIVKIELLGTGAFAAAYKGWVVHDENKTCPYYLREILHVHDQQEDGDGGRLSSRQRCIIAFKEFKESMVVELIMNVMMFKFSKVTFIAANFPVIGLSQHPTKGCYLMAMIFAKGGTLESMRTRQGRNWEDVSIVALELASKLREIHNMGFSHRDIHPGNLAFRYDDRDFCALIDFGLAQSVETEHSGKGVYGRIEYLPPEVFEEKVQTPASDVYCFATLLWQYITGVPPRDTAAVAIRSFPEHLREELIPDAPHNLNYILRKCWNPDQDKRPDMDQVFKWLVRVIHDISTHSDSALVSFSEKTLSFIATRQAEYQKMEHAVSVSSDGTTESIPHRSSQFHSLERLHSLGEATSQIPPHGNAGESALYEPIGGCDDINVICTVFMGGLSWNVDKDWLRSELEDCGTIVNVHIVTDRDLQRSHGYAFVEFESPEGAQAALAIAGKKIDGRTFRINILEPWGYETERSGEGLKSQSESSIVLTDAGKETEGQAGDQKAGGSAGNVSDSQGDLTIVSMKIEGPSFDAHPLGSRVHEADHSGGRDNKAKSEPITPLAKNRKKIGRINLWPFRGRKLHRGNDGDNEGRSHGRSGGDNETNSRPNTSLADADKQNEGLSIHKTRDKKAGRGGSSNEASDRDHLGNRAFTQLKPQLVRRLEPIASKLRAVGSRISRIATLASRRT